MGQDQSSATSLDSKGRPTRSCTLNGVGTTQANRTYAGTIMSLDGAKQRASTALASKPPATPINHKQRARGKNLLVVLRDEKQTMLVNESVMERLTVLESINQYVLVSCAAVPQSAKEDILETLNDIALADMCRWI